MLAASKQLKVLEARGERVRDVQHLEDIARPAQSAAGQAGSHRQVNALTPEWLWTQYKGHVGEGPVAADAHTPLLCSLRDLYTTDQDGFFDGLVHELLTTTSWRPGTFGKENGVREEWTKSVRQYAERQVQIVVCGSHTGR